MLYKKGDVIHLNMELDIHITKEGLYDLDEMFLKGVIRGALASAIDLCKVENESDS